MKTALLASIPFSFSVLFSQSPPAPQHKFEVATIRVSKDTANNFRIGPGPNGGMKTENTSALMLITFAYGVRDFEVANAPGWAKTDRFNVIGTPDQPEQAPSPTMKRDSMEQMFDRQRQRMQALLQERFGLVLRTEMREMPVYSLTVLKGGHKLVDAAEGRTNMRTQRGKMSGEGANLKMLTHNLSNLLGRPVVDETGLTGAYNFEMEWTPDASLAEDAAAPGDVGPTIFTAIKEKLGLRLDAKKGPSQVLVIEKIEKPTEN